MEQGGSRGRKTISAIQEVTILGLWLWLSSPSYLVFLDVFNFFFSAWTNQENVSAKEAKVEDSFLMDDEFGFDYVDLGAKLDCANTNSMR